MLYFLDTANLETIRRLCEYYPVDGVTTNPTIISREHADFAELVLAIRKIIGSERMLHVQVTSHDCDNIVREARALRDFIGGNLYIKIPVTADGLKATAALKAEGINVTQTAVFTPQQALIAAKSGADFVALFVNRLDNVVGDGTNVVAETVRLFDIYNLDSKVIAASFKTVEQIHKIAVAGAHSATLSPDLLEALARHPLTDAAIGIFDSDWKSVYGEKKLLDFINQAKQ